MREDDSMSFINKTTGYQQNMHNYLHG